MAAPGAPFEPMHEAKKCRAAHVPTIQCTHGGLVRCRPHPQAQRDPAQPEKQAQPHRWPHASRRCSAGPAAPRALAGGRCGRLPAHLCSSRLVSQSQPQSGWQHRLRSSRTAHLADQKPLQNAGRRDDKRRGETGRQRTCSNLGAGPSLERGSNAWAQHKRQGQRRPGSAPRTAGGSGGAAARYARPPAGPWSVPEPRCRRPHRTLQNTETLGKNLSGCM